MISALAVLGSGLVLLPLSGIVQEAVGSWQVIRAGSPVDNISAQQGWLAYSIHAQVRSADSMAPELSVHVMVCACMCIVALVLLTVFKRMAAKTTMGARPRARGLPLLPAHAALRQ